MSPRRIVPVWIRRTLRNALGGSRDVPPDVGKMLKVWWISLAVIAVALVAFIIYTTNRLF